MTRSTWICLIAVALIPMAVSAEEAVCPSKDEILEHLSGIDPARGSRTTRFNAPVPTELYEKAAAKTGESVAFRDGKTVWGVLVTDHPVEVIWKALNDEDHHVLDGVEYVPVKYSEVIDGTPRGKSRLLFQYFKQAGIGRWWVSRVEMNGELFETSEGAIWELYWEDVVDSIDPTQPPMNQVSSKVAALEDSYGAWFIVPINGHCTLLEYYNFTEPGGYVGFAQALLAKKSVRDTLDGIVRIADEHLSDSHPGLVFVRPDGTPID
jgi:hypothetical protein